MKGEQIRRVRSVSVPMTKTIAGEHQTDLKKIRDGRVGYDVEITIDVDALFQFLGAKAIANRSGHALDVGGIVVARRLDGTRLRTNEDGTVRGKKAESTD
jgi:hypothetical protein